MIWRSTLQKDGTRGNAVCKGAKLDKMKPIHCSSTASKLETCSGSTSRTTHLFKKASERNWMIYFGSTYQYMGVSLNGGTQQPWVLLLKMIILGCFGGTTILGNPHIYHVKFNRRNLPIFFVMEAKAEEAEAKRKKQKERPLQYSSHL